MAEISSNGRGKKNPPKVPDKATTPYRADGPKPTAQKETNVSTTATVDSNARPIAKPRNVNIPTFHTPKTKSSTERKIGVLLPCFTEYEAQNTSNRKPIGSSEHPTEITNAASPKTSEPTSPNPPTPNIEYENSRSATLPLSDKQATHKVVYPPTTKNIEYENTRSATLPLSDKQATHNVVYRVPTRKGKENLPVTRGSPKNYRLLLPPTPVNGNPPRKPAMPPNVNIEKFRVALESGYTTDDLSGGGVLDRMDTQLQYDEAIYEV